MSINAATAEIVYEDYTDEAMIPDIQRLVSKDLSEPYSVFTYRYFLHNCPRFCICAYAMENGCREMMATIVCKLEGEGDEMQGYMAMLAVDQAYRQRGIGRQLVVMVIDRMIQDGCREVMLETEASNLGALSLYTKLGFAKDEKMAKYYLNGGDAYRLKLWISEERARQTSRTEKTLINEPVTNSVIVENTHTHFP
ncbi:acyl-CoA N-acyltransferase [Ochromonadaceae sp. CCMP2298]|nr:acyl-CoA N-acyltransferase [Ochromonadaceae sp. CCMP2298]|mmetsp:Transcript_9079/g.20016  ORF Transcript_9079/g.20016 Transcript_9079/m.20016 type:complete len:196 (+) Transcript_9079:176-763(+)